MTGSRKNENLTKNANIDAAVHTYLPTTNTSALSKAPSPDADQPLQNKRTTMYDHIPPKNEEVAEINGSITSHPPIMYSLHEVDISPHNFTELRRCFMNTETSDPRLRRIIGLPDLSLSSQIIGLARTVYITDKNSTIIHDNNSTANVLVHTSPKPNDDYDMDDFTPLSPNSPTSPSDTFVEESIEMVEMKSLLQGEETTQRKRHLHVDENEMDENENSKRRRLDSAPLHGILHEKLVQQGITTIEKLNKLTILELEEFGLTLSDIMEIQIQLNTTQIKYPEAVALPHVQGIQAQVERNDAASHEIQQIHKLLENQTWFKTLDTNARTTIQQNLALLRAELKNFHQDTSPDKTFDLTIIEKNETIKNVLKKLNVTINERGEIIYMESDENNNDVKIENLSDFVTPPAVMYPHDYPNIGMSDDVSLQAQIKNDLLAPIFQINPYNTFSTQIESIIPSMLEETLDMNFKYA